jgi:hypothetical protein
MVLPKPLTPMADVLDWHLGALEAVADDQERQARQAR